MPCYTLLCYNVVWYGMVWYGMVWYFERRRYAPGWVGVEGIVSTWLPRLSLENEKERKGTKREKENRYDGRYPTSCGIGIGIRIRIGVFRL